MVRSARAAGLIFVLFVLVLVLPCGRTMAQQTIIPISGVLTDAEQQPVAGFRVALRVGGTTNFLVSNPTDENGTYTVDVPTGANCAPVAVVSPLGERIMRLKRRSTAGTSKVLSSPLAR